MLSALGSTSLTAWVGMTQIGDPKPGELVVVSGAAGATGSVAGQIAKIKGARVVGICGSDDKCRWLTEELGFDVALNYKAEDFKKRFNEATKDYIDVYYDNGKLIDPPFNST
jgi:NADPH-dependent curcumin reductase CurA